MMLLCLDEGPQYCINARLVAPSIAPKPGEHVLVQAQGNGFLGLRPNNPGIGPIRRRG